MRTRRSAALTGLLTLLLAVTPSAVRAQQVDADALITRGNALRRAGRDDEALALYRQAWERARSPYARAEVALAEAATGRWLEAAEDLDAALAAPDAWVTRHRAVLEAVRTTIAQHLGALELTCDVDGAAVDINDRAVGVTPLRSPLRIAEGEATLVVRADGRPIVTRRLTIVAGSTSRESVTVPPAAVAGPTAPANAASREPSVEAPRAQLTPRARRPRVVIPITDDERTATPPPDDAAPRLQTVFGWTAAALAGVSLSIGLGGLVAQRDGRARLPAYNGCFDETSCLDLCMRVESCRARYESEERWRAVAWAGFVVGGALSAAAIALLVTARGDSAPAPHARATCGLSLTSPSVTCAVRF
ncbi:MAG: tetratricopeptide repeat protein [Polyangiales bacterium]